MSQSDNGSNGGILEEEGSFSNSGSPNSIEAEEPQAQNYGQSSQIEEDTQDKWNYQGNNTEEIEESYNLDSRRLNPPPFDVNSWLKLTHSLRVLEDDKAFLMKQLWDQKEQYQNNMADKNAQIAYMDNLLGNVERERDELKQRNQELQAKVNVSESSLQRGTLDFKTKILGYQESELKFGRTQGDLSRLQMENELIKVDLNKLQAEVNNLKTFNNTLSQENEELRRIVNENRETSLNNQTSILNLGIPSYRSQLTLKVEDFNLLGITPGSINLNSNTIYEFCELLLNKLKEIRGKIKYYEDNDFERVANELREENYKIKEDLLLLQNVKNNLVELNTKLQVTNEELLNNNLMNTRAQEILNQKEAEVCSKDETILQKEKIIQELQRLIEIYDSQIGNKETILEEDQMEEENQLDESKESLLKKYNQSKQDWIVLMRDYKSLRQIIKEYQERDPNNAEKYEESFLNSLIRENKQLKEANKKLEENSKQYYEHAIQKISQFKEIVKSLLGWDLRIKNEIIEIRSVLTQKEDEVLVLKEFEQGQYTILDIDEYAKRLFENMPHLADLKENSYPLFFAYLSVMSKPEFKNLFLF